MSLLCFSPLIALLHRNRLSRNAGITQFFWQYSGNIFLKIFWECAKFSSKYWCKHKRTSCIVPEAWAWPQLITIAIANTNTDGNTNKYRYVCRNTNKYRWRKKQIRKKNVQARKLFTPEAWVWPQPQTQYISISTEHPSQWKEKSTLKNYYVFSKQYGKILCIWLRF